MGNVQLIVVEAQTFATPQQLKTTTKINAKQHY